MDRRIQKLGIIFVLISAFSVLVFDQNRVFAQSGRGRQPTAPPPKPAPKPNSPVTTVLGVPEGGKLVKQDVDSLTSRFILKNGLTVLIRERHSSPLVSVNVSVRAGSIHESDEMAGISRLVRRAILRGTATRNRAAIDREVARLGGVLTSASSIDLTSFNLIVPSESYQAGVELLTEMLLKPAFNAEDLKKVAGEALLETKRAQSDPGELAFEKLFSAAFTTSPLKRGNAVPESLLASVTRETVQAYYQNFYQPQNLAVTVVGDIFSVQALGQIQLNFGKMAKTAAPSTWVLPNIDDPVQDKLRYANTRADLGQSFATIGYRTAAIKNDKDGLKEWAALEMLTTVLGVANGSRMWQGLREGQASRDKASVAFEAKSRFLVLPGAGQSFGQYFGMLVARMRVDPNRIDRAEAEYFREIERFRREIVGDGELQRARAVLEKRHFDTISRIETEAEALARHQLLFGDFRLFDSILARIRTVTAQDIQQAAAKYLTLSNATVLELEPTKAPARSFSPEKFAELVVTFEPRAGQPVKTEEVKPAVALKTFTQGSERGLASEGHNIVIAPAPLPIKDFSVLRGPRAFVREDRSLPLLSVGVYFQGGRLVENQTTSGTTELMLRSMLKSTTVRKAELIAQELESYGGEIQIVNEPDFFGFTLSILSRNAENGIKLLLEIIESPFFDKTEVARERDALLADQFAFLDDSVTRASDLMWSSIYPDHPYGQPRYGLPEVVKVLTDEKLDAWYAKSIKRQLPLVIIVGDTDGSALISRIFSDGLKRGELDKTIKANLPVSPNPPQDRIEQRARGMTAQALGFRVAQLPPERQDDYLALEMFANLASLGKLPEELRDKQALTDEATVRFEQRLASGAFFAEISTIPGNEQRARDALVGALESMAASQTTDEEFEQGRNATIGRYSIALQQHPARTIEYARAVLFGLKATDVESQPDRIRTIKKADIRRVAEGVVKTSQVGRGVVRGN